MPVREIVAARAEELACIKKEQVYIEVPREQARVDGIRPLTLLWVDTNKSLYPETWKIRSRFCKREYNTKTKGGAVRGALPAAQLFSAMPPLEALKIVRTDGGVARCPRPGPR